MRLRQLDLNLFLVFDAIYTECNLTRAAERLNITQPAVSNALARMRRSLEDPLFVRTPQAMVPTPVAENMIGPVRQALQLLNTSIQLSSSFEPHSAEKTFNLSMHDVIEAAVLPGLLSALRERAPKLSLTSHLVRRVDLVKEFSAGNLDLAIDIPALNHPDLCHQPLIEFPYVCLVRPDHPEVGDELTLEQYLALPHLHVSSRRSGGGYVDAVLSKLSRSRYIQMRIEHYLVAPRLIEKTDLLLTVPRNLAFQTKLKVLPLPFEMEAQQWHLYWHRSADKDRANAWLRSQIIGLHAADRAHQSN